MRRLAGGDMGSIPFGALTATTDGVDASSRPRVKAPATRN